MIGRICDLLASADPSTVVPDALYGYSPAVNVIGICAVMPVVSLAFIQLGIDPIRFFEETIGAVVVLVVIVAVDRGYFNG